MINLTAYCIVGLCDSLNFEVFVLKQIYKKQIFTYLSQYFSIVLIFKISNCSKIMLQVLLLYIG